MNLSSLNTFQQAILFSLLILGSSILVSSTVLLVRKRAFQSKFKGISDERERVRSRRALAFYMANREGAASSGLPTENVASDPANQDENVISMYEVPKITVDDASQQPRDNHVQWDDDDQITIHDPRPEHHHHRRVFPMVGVGARPDLNNHPRDVQPNLPPDEEDELSGLKGILRGTQKYFASKGLISRNSQFHGLTAAERETLGGVEYKAVSFLSVIVPIYFFMFLVLGIMGVGGWLEANRPSVARENGLSPFWTGSFFAVSAFVNSGMSLLDANMTALQTKYVASTLASKILTAIVRTHF